MNDIPEVECYNCWWTGDADELVISRGFDTCPSCGSVDVWGYEDEDELLDNEQEV